MAFKVCRTSLFRVASFVDVSNPLCTSSRRTLAPPPLTSSSVASPSPASFPTAARPPQSLLLLPPSPPAPPSPLACSAMNSATKCATAALRHHLLPRLAPSRVTASGVLRGSMRRELDELITILRSRLAGGAYVPVHGRAHAEPNRPSVS